MIDLRFGRYALSICVAVGVLAACGGQASNGVVPATAAASNFPYHKTFKYTGGAQNFKVPAGVRQLKVIALGAHGGGISATRGGRVSAIIPVTPGEVLVLYVGGNGSEKSGGFNGGANGGEGYAGGHPGYGGGGASDIREHGESLGDRILVSGGAGGEGGTQGRYAAGGAGGKGGGLTGGTGGAGGGYFSYGGGAGGQGGTQHAGGLGGLGSDCYGSYPTGAKGLLGVGGAGGLGGGYQDNPGGGGGGGGYYGGGGGGGGSSYQAVCFTAGGGGGGGSSYAERKATDVRMWQAWKQSAGNGLVVLSWQ